jgi:hypothetical protein
MRSIRKDAKIIAIAIVAFLIIAQFIRMKKLNPPVQAEIAAGAEIEPILRRACYDCHSHETTWPWYSNLAPVSWLVGSDVKDGRKHLNFSEWGNYSAEMKGHKLMAIAEEVGENGMPPWYYSWAHPKSRLGEAERNRIRNWAEAAAEASKRSAFKLLKSAGNNPGGSKQ